MHELQKLVLRQKAGEHKGICSVCSSSPFVLDAAIRQAKESGTVVLIEATANQVNQFGGYTGMTPADFRAALLERAAKQDFPAERVIMAGDHLGPVAWQKEPKASAMEKAEVLVYQFARAGYTKIHLDASMPLADDELLVTEEIARRTVFLCKAAERGYSEFAQDNPGAQPPVYVIGSEVPTPGGSGDEEGLNVTKPEALTDMLQIFETEFMESGLSDAWSRVVAAVVQPGVEFGNDNVHEYVPSEATELIATARKIPNIMLEGHSTDYQPESCLTNMVRDGIAILKVGPALTFAAREGLYALAYIEQAMGITEPSYLIEVLESAMLTAPGNWKGHYQAQGARLKQLRQYSYSDRSRYYMTQPQVVAAIDQLISNLRKNPIPMTMLSQFLPYQYEHIRAGKLKNDPEEIVLDKVRDTLKVYWRACGEE